jgi:hypothetical protein
MSGGPPVSISVLISGGGVELFDSSGGDGGENLGGLDIGRRVSPNSQMIAFCFAGLLFRSRGT